MVYRGKPRVRTHRWADAPLKDEVWFRPTYPAEWQHSSLPSVTTFRAS